MIGLRNLKENVLLAPYTTLRLGGPARYFVEVKTSDQIAEAVHWAKEQEIPFLVVGCGSNLLVSDKGFPGLIIRNLDKGIHRKGDKLRVRGGTLLADLINFSINAGLGGLEKIAGIPGTVAGAVYGNAGAYGQEISDHLTNILVFDGEDMRRLDRNQCRFSYRSSIFKSNKDLVILEVEFTLNPAGKFVLKDEARKIIALRAQKYPPSLLCPGSFFKNLWVEDLPPETVNKIPKEKIVHKKVPAGYLLEAVGARGKSRGGIKIADYHGNLFINTGKGTPQDFWDIVQLHQRKVKKKFGILLEPEVQLVGFEVEKNEG